MRKIDLSPPPVVVQNLAASLIPVTQHDVIFREIGENPFLRSIGTFTTVTLGGFVLGSVGNVAMSLVSDSGPFSFKKATKEGIMFGLKFGTEIAMTELVETSLSVYRGKSKPYDKIIAGAFAGATCNVHTGFRGIARGAANGAAMASFLALVQFASEKL